MTYDVLIVARGRLALQINGQPLRAERVAEWLAARTLPLGYWAVLVPHLAPRLP